MGQHKSKVAPVTSDPALANNAEASSTEEEISTPAPPRHINRFSELIDFNELFEEEEEEEEEERSPTVGSPTSHVSPSSPTSPSSPGSPTWPTWPSSPNSASFADSPGSPSSLAPLTTRRPKRVMVQSPSGQILTPLEFLQRPDRALTIEERKQSIRLNTASQIRLAEESQGKKGRKCWPKKARRGCWGFCGA
ncbi:hypothetical protein MMC07_002207 [Pseudocyphellaria aurata]|nr:hypothetical protein [Pseudocyphellaria aurata]